MRLARPTKFATHPLPAAALALSLVLSLSTWVHAAPPETILVQGMIAANGGGAVVDGGYKLSFALYAGANAVNPVWSESAASVQVVGGHFVHALGSVKPLSAKQLADLQTPQLGLKVGDDPELPRVPLRAVAYARHAALASGLACSGCVDSDQIAPGAVLAGHAGFTWAGSKTKSGPATSALDLQCTGCVSVAELNIDGDLDLGGNALKAKSVAAGTVQATQVTASSFVGDGSQLTGIVVPAGSCKGKDEVVTGIKADGSLICIALQTELPADGLSQVSGGLLSNIFTVANASAKAVDIKDNDPVGMSDEIEVPDLGTVKTLTIELDITTSSTGQLKVLLYDPDNGEYLLHDNSGDAKTLKIALPNPTPTVLGDLGAWVGKNAKGKWRLRVIDKKANGDAVDGKLNSWKVKIETVSNKKVESSGLLVTSGGVDFANAANKGFRFEVAAKAPVTCDPAHTGYAYYDQTLEALRFCDGKAFKILFQTPSGSTKETAAAHCLALRQEGQTKNGIYWIKTGGPGTEAQTYCDMTTDGGGWTLVMRMSTYDPGINFNHNQAGWSATSYGNVAQVVPGSLTGKQDFVAKAYGGLTANNVLIRQSLTSTKHSVRTTDSPLGGVTLRSVLTQSIIDGGRKCSKSIAYGAGSPIKSAMKFLVFAGDESGDTEPARIALRTGCAGDAETMALGYTRSGHGSHEVFSQSNHWPGLASVYIFVR